MYASTIFGLALVHVITADFPMPPPKQQNIQMQSNNLMQSNIPIQSSVPMQSNIPDNLNTNIANPPNPSSFQPLSSVDPSNPNCDVPSFYTDIVTTYPKYNQTCKTDDECNFGPDRAMVCKNEICVCSDTYELFSIEKMLALCQPLPRFIGEPCRSSCHKPLVCKENQQPAGLVQDSPVMNLQFPISTKTCQCENPYKTDGGDCIAECAENEIYDRNSTKCLKKCKENEIRINIECKPLVQLGEICQSGVQCRSAFSECKNQKCSCIEGFDENNRVCNPRTLNCPFGDALKDSIGYFQCSVGMTQNNSAAVPIFSFVDTCPDQYSCVITSTSYGTSTNQKSTGHCCPKMVPKCPFGQPHPTATCDMYDQSKKGQIQCPFDTHTCSPSFQNVNNQPICCPMACSSGNVFVDNKCYPLAAIGDACSVDEQCSSFRGTCQNGICKCAKNSLEMGSYPSKSCYTTCTEDEVMFNDVCFKTLKLGDSCEQQEWRCSVSAKCDRNKKCSCSCGFVQLNEKTCAPPAVCFQPNMYFNPITGQERLFPKNSYDKSNVTYCRIKDLTPPVSENLVDECPAGTQCSFYLFNLGLCCPKAPLVCPSGVGSTNATCVDQINNACKYDEYCYFPNKISPYSQIQQSQQPDSGICCPILDK